MTVVHIGWQYGLNNTGGAAIAATRLHLALLERGVDSHYVCVRSQEEGPNVHVLPTGGRRWLYKFATKVTRCIWKFTPCRKSIPVQIVPLFGLEKLLAEIKPDVVHIHWMGNDTCSYEQISRLKCKVVFNLHDLSIINALSSHPCDDRRFKTGYDRSNSGALERWLFNRKRRMVAALRPSFVAPSEWTARECRESLIGHECEVTVIPNIIDSGLSFKPELLDTDPKRPFRMLFVAFHGRRNLYKGFDDLEKALEILAENLQRSVELLVVGESAADYDLKGIRVRFLGRITDSREMEKIYHTSDLFVLPSKRETQSMAKFEAMRCGLPVVTFNRGACAEGIISANSNIQTFQHSNISPTGWVAPDGDCRSFAEGIRYFMDHPADRAAIAAKAAEYSTTDALVEKVLSVYRE